jgi:hypothetical protein
MVYKNTTSLGWGGGEGEAGTYLRLRLWSLTGSRSGRLGSSSGSALRKNKNLYWIISNQDLFPFPFGEVINDKKALNGVCQPLS